VIGLAGSLIGYLWHLTEYHVLLDGEMHNLCRQLKVLPFYLVHVVFRALVATMVLVFWKVGDLYFLFLHLVSGVGLGPGVAYRRNEHLPDPLDYQN
jgi:hypothetical protein